METHVNRTIAAFRTQFIQDVRQKAIELDVIHDPKIQEVLQYIMDYHKLTFKKEDFIKRKRNKIGIEINDRCIAKSSNGEQCTRRKQKKCDYCGTHSKGTPFGICEPIINDESVIHEFEIRAQDVNGIVYFIDTYNNVYCHNDVISNKKNPHIIGTYYDNPNHDGEPEIRFNF